MSEVDIQIRNAGWRKIPEVRQLVHRAVDTALEGRNSTEISVLLTGDHAVRMLNARYRQKNQSTNVLSFPSGAKPEASPFLGDIALAYETCAREAEAEGKTLTDHLTHLVIHGTLHLLGHDHETDAEAEAMEALETRLLAGLGIADPYAESASDARDRGVA